MKENGKVKKPATKRPKRSSRNQREFRPSGQRARRAKRLDVWSKPSGKKPMKNGLSPWKRTKLTKRRYTPLGRKGKGAGGSQQRPMKEGKKKDALGESGNKGSGNDPSSMRAKKKKS